MTAQKREENKQDVPISLSVFSGDQLDVLGVTNPTDLPLITPGLNIQQQAGFSVTYLRGVGSDTYLMGDPSVALYIDGIYFPFAHGLAQDFGAVERIEVLKGPQGTLFGRNAVGGAISVVTEQPYFDDFTLSTQLSYSDRYDDKRVRVHSNIPLTDELAISVSAIKSETQPVMSGSINGGGIPDDEAEGIRVKLRWAPSDSIDLLLAGFKLKQEGVATMFALNSDPSLITSAAGASALTGYSGDVDGPTYFKLDNEVIYGQFTYITDWFDVKILASDQYIETNSLYDFDGTTAPLVVFEAKKQFADVQSAELQILSNDQSWGSDWLEWIVGAYYFTSQQGFDPVQLSVAGLNLEAGEIAGVALPPLLLDLLNDLNSGIFGNNLPNYPLHAYGIINNDSIAGFFQTTATITDWLSVTLGARYQVEDREIERSETLVQPLGLPINADSAGLNDTTTSLKPKASFEFRPQDDILFYLSYQEAIKSATYNVINIYDTADYVEAEELEAVEFGMKADFFDGLVRFNVAAFQYEISNLQVQFVSLLQGGAVTFENAGGAEIKGADFDTTVQVLPSLIDNFIVNIGGAYLDSEYTDYDNASGFDETTGILTTDNDFTGNDVARTPRWSGTFSLVKTFEIPGGPLELGGNLYYNSGFNYIAQDTEISHEDEYSVISARVSYLYENWGLRVTAFGQNLGDQNYNAGRFINDFGALDVKAPREHYGVRINLDI